MAKGGPEREREKAPEGDRNRDTNGMAGRRKGGGLLKVWQVVSRVSVSVCKIGLDPRKEETMPAMFEL